MYSRNNLPKIKDGTYVISLDEVKLIEAHSIALYVNGNDAIYFNSFNYLKWLKLKKIIGNKNIRTNVYVI